MQVPPSPSASPGNAPPSKAQVHYRRGTAQASCGQCTYFDQDWCAFLATNVDRMDVCDMFTPLEGGEPQQEIDAAAVEAQLFGM